ncbi:MAG TPA: RNA polymerase sigma factor, partial [Acidimicrobiia bacterium]
MSDEELFAQLYPSLRRFAAVAKTPEADADDLVQEALVRALALRPLSEYTNPAAYLRRTMLNLASNAHRSSGRARRALRRLGAPTEARVDYPSDLEDLLQLAPVQRAAVYLAVVEGLSHAAIGETLGCSEAAARTRVSRGL